MDSEADKKPDAAAPPAEPQKEEPVFPALEGGQDGVHYFDQRRATFWIGIKIPGWDFEGAKAFLRSMDLQLYFIYREMLKQLRMRAELAKGPPAHGKRSIGDILKAPFRS